MQQSWKQLHTAGGVGMLPEIIMKRGREVKMPCAEFKFAGLLQFFAPAPGLFLSVLIGAALL